MNKCIFTILVCLVIAGCKTERGSEPQVDYYQQNYQTCLEKARKGTAYTHETMKEEALGGEITTCLAQFGWGEPE